MDRSLIKKTNEKHSKKKKKTLFLAFTELKSNYCKPERTVKFWLDTSFLLPILSALSVSNTSDSDGNICFIHFTK